MYRVKITIEGKSEKSMKVFKTKKQALAYAKSFNSKYVNAKASVTKAKEGSIGTN